MKKVQFILGSGCDFKIRGMLDCKITEIGEGEFMDEIGHKYFIKTEKTYSICVFSVMDFSINIFKNGESIAIVSAVDELKCKTRVGRPDTIDYSVKFKIVELYCENYTQEKIAQKCDVSLSTVRRELKQYKLEQQFNAIG